MNERKQGKYRNILLEGRPLPNGCNCGPFKEEMEFDSVKEGENSNRKDWEPTTHNQTCPTCNKEYYLDWTVEERTYL